VHDAHLAMVDRYLYADFSGEGAADTSNENREAKERTETAFGGGVTGTEIFGRSLVTTL
jgi:hypothetical protein